MIFQSALFYWQSILLVLLVGYLVLRIGVDKRVIQSDIIRILLIYFGYVIITTFWSKNTCLSIHSIPRLLLYGMTFLVGLLYYKKVRFQKIMTYLLSLFFIYWLIVYLCFDLYTVHNWNKYFGGNCNFVAASVSCLYVLVAYRKDTSKNVLLIIFTGYVFVLMISVVSGSRAVQLMNLLILIYLIVFYGFRVLFERLILLLPLAVVILIVGIPLADKDSFRYFQLFETFNSSTINWLFGVGNDNWLLAHGDVDIASFNSSFGAYTFPSYRSHNALLKVLAELGLFGLVLHLGIFIAVINKTIAKRFYPLYLFFILFLFYSNVYASMDDYGQDIGTMKLLSFYLLGGIYRDRHIDVQGSVKIWTKVIVSIVLFCLVCILGKNYVHIGKRLKNVVRKEVVETDLGELMFMYNQTGIRDLNYNKSLALEIGRKFRSDGRLDLAKKYYTLGLKDFPNNSKLHLEYAKYLYRNDGNFKETLFHAQRAKILNSGNISINLFLSEILMSDEKLVEAERYLLAVEKNHYFVFVHEIAGLLRLKMDLHNKLQLGEVSSTRRVGICRLNNSVDVIIAENFELWERFDLTTKSSEYAEVKFRIVMATSKLRTQLDSIE